jgi:hypothetical protein
MDDVLKVSDIERESQAVLDSITINYFHGASEAWKNNGIAVYVPKETILMEMAATIKLSQHFFSDLVQELSDNLVLRKIVSKRQVLYCTAEDHCE